MMIEDLAVILTLPYFSSSHALSLHGISALEPVDDVDVVNMLLDDMISANPVEVIPVPQLIFHLRLTFLARIHPHTFAIPPCLSRHKLSDLSVLVFVVEGTIRFLVVTLQPNNNIQLLLFC